MRTGIIDETRRKFTAQYFADLSKAVFAVALASKLFGDLAVWLRVGLALLGVAFFVLAFFINPKGER